MGSSPASLDPSNHASAFSQPEILSASSAYGLSDSSSTQAGHTTPTAIARPSLAIRRNARIRSDFDGDNIADIPYRDPSTGQLSLLLIRNDQAQSSVSIGPSIKDQNWEIQAIADLNNDEQSDFVWRHNKSQQTLVWLMNGDKTVKEAAVLESVRDKDWSIRGAGDFGTQGSATLDGKDDLLWYNAKTGDRVVWYMDGTQKTGQAQMPDARIGDQTLLGTADFDGDNKTDLAWRASDGTVSIWTMDGINRVGEPEVVTGVTKDSNWSPSGFGDYDGDGKADISWENKGTKEHSLWKRENGNIMDKPFTRPNPIAPGGGTTGGNENPGGGNNTGGGDAGGGSTGGGDTTGGNQERPFNITFDYSKDTNNWFTTERRATLEASADVWERIILSDFPNIPANSQTAGLGDPSTEDETALIGDSDGIFTTPEEIDDLLIFVSAIPMSDSTTLATAAAASGFQDDQRYQGNSFQPWVGSMNFNSSLDWFFDATPDTRDDVPQNQNDFISTAVHEMGHILGISDGVPAFNRLVQNGTFIGAQTQARNGNQPLPLGPQNSHIEDDHTIGDIGETNMDVRDSGGRILPTILDIALLDDIGYDVDYGQAYKNPAPPSAL